MGLVEPLTLQLILVEIVGNSHLTLTVLAGSDVVPSTLVVALAIKGCGETMMEWRRSIAGCAA